MSATLSSSDPSLPPTEPPVLISAAPETLVDPMPPPDTLEAEGGLAGPCQGPGDPAIAICEMVVAPEEAEAMIELEPVPVIGTAIFTLQPETGDPAMTTMVIPQDTASTQEEAEIVITTLTPIALEEELPVAVTDGTLTEEILPVPVIDDMVTLTEEELPVPVFGGTAPLPEEELAATTGMSGGGGGAAGGSGGVANAAPEGSVTIHGAAIGGAVLVGAQDLSDADGLGELGYQWQRQQADGEWQDIAGATQESLALGRADLGHAIRLAITYVDGQGHEAQLFSEATDPVAGRPIALVTMLGERPPVFSSAELGQRLAEGGVFEDAPSELQLADGVLSLGAGTGIAFVARLYAGLLGRDADKAGLMHWAEDGAVDRQAVAQGLLDSAEYQALHAVQDDAAYLQHLYEALLGRAADAAGQSFYGGLLAGGAGRADVLAAIADSAEAQSHWQELTSAGIFVPDAEAGLIRAAYAAAFGREADAGGLAFFGKALAAGGSLVDFAETLVNSAEFRAAHAGENAADFVRGLYAEGLGRDGDAQEVAWYVEQLESGAMDQAEAVLAFATSTEAAQLQHWAL